MTGFRISSNKPRLNHPSQCATGLIYKYHPVYKWLYIWSASCMHLYTHTATRFSLHVCAISYNEQPEDISWFLCCTAGLKAVSLCLQRFFVWVAVCVCRETALMPTAWDQVLWFYVSDVISFCVALVSFLSGWGLVTVDANVHVFLWPGAFYGRPECVFPSGVVFVARRWKLKCFCLCLRANL